MWGAAPFFSKPSSPYHLPKRPALTRAYSPPRPPSPACHQVTLFVNHLTDGDDQTLMNEMSAYGSVVRCFVVRAPGEGGVAGRSKGYGFVEFALPAAAKAALRALEQHVEVEKQR